MGGDGRGSVEEDIVDKNPLTTFLDITSKHQTTTMSIIGTSAWSFSMYVPVFAVLLVAGNRHLSGPLGE